MKVTHQYVAGFFDGEGCIYLGRHKSVRHCAEEAQWSFRVSIINTYLPILEAIQQKYGGRIRAAKHYGNNADNWRQVWVWTIHAKTAGKFLTEVTPYLVEKKSRAMAALFFCDTYSWSKRWKELTEEQKQMRRIAVRAFEENPNKRGKRAA